VRCREFGTVRVSLRGIGKARKGRGRSKRSEIRERG